MEECKALDSRAECCPNELFHDGGPYHFQCKLMDWFLFDKRPLIKELTIKTPYSSVHCYRSEVLILTLSMLKTIVLRGK